MSWFLLSGYALVPSQEQDGEGLCLEAIAGCLDQAMGMSRPWWVEVKLHAEMIVRSNQYYMDDCEGGVEVVIARRPVTRTSARTLI